LRIPAGETDFLARADQWMAMAYLVGPPYVFARIAIELIRSAVHKQSDVTTALATRLDPAVVARVWALQTAW
jgi:hypothetical protein